MSGGSSGVTAIGVQVTRWHERWGTAKLKSTAGATGGAPMCDYSLQNVKTRPARVGDKLVTLRFSTPSAAGLVEGLAIAALIFWR
jgi:hypothetical protein